MTQRNKGPGSICRADHGLSPHYTGQAYQYWSLNTDYPTDRQEHAPVVASADPHMPTAMPCASAAPGAPRCHMEFPPEPTFTTVPTLPPTPPFAPALLCIPSHIKRRLSQAHTPLKCRPAVLAKLPVALEGRWVGLFAQLWGKQDGLGCRALSPPQKCRL